MTSERARTSLRAVLFDWGGTLSVHQPAELADMWQAAARTLAPDDVESMTARLVQIEARSWERCTTTLRSARLMDLLMEASDELGLDVAEAVLDAAGRAHLDAWTPSIRHHGAAEEVLRQIKGDGLATGLLSNTHWPRSFHEHFLQRDGLADLLDARLYTSEIDWIKPHPEPFRRLCETLGVLPKECVFVGDRPIDDIQGGRALGMRTVWVRNDHTPGDGEIADIVIDDLTELPQALAASDGSSRTT